ncbi:OLC1v1027342C1 [Oldenlandia corymbosa var. corymbosa]|uniref:OLC1v1027342C1 n=1 Tax=Oldenlandia corymbosa var. corymbosa TaxID=529605 RepID=A0AAV1C995_OLDCO|nr:OLC1v1027342C1 [Oldenlandia corymbosa var. corymbosa]
MLLQSDGKQKLGRIVEAPGSIEQIQPWAIKSEPGLQKWVKLNWIKDGIRSNKPIYPISFKFYPSTIQTLSWKVDALNPDVKQLLNEMPGLAGVIGAIRQAQTGNGLLFGWAFVAAFI